jgi:hypothetical protein
MKKAIYILILFAFLLLKEAILKPISKNGQLQAKDG